ncbi:TPA: hypothetical protein ACF328_000004 [Clostridium perfringens]
MLIKEISINNKSLFTVLCFNNKSNDFINLNFESLTVDEIIEQNINSVVKKYILNEKNIIFFNSVQNNKNKFIDLINKLDIKFKNLSLIGSKLEYIDKKGINSIINEQNKYGINTNMIKYIYNSNNKFDILVEHVSYSMIPNSNNEYMKKYISDNINIYIKNVFLDGNYMDDENIEYIIELLNLESLKNDLQVEIIKRKNFIISSFTEITNIILLDELLLNNKVSISWSNLNFYFNKNLNNYLINYLNLKSNIEILADEIISKEVIDDYFDFKCKIILEQNIDDKSIEKFKNLFNEPLGDINLSSISNERLLLLIQLKIIKLTPAIYNPIAKKSNSIVLIEQNIDKYMDNRE